MELFQGIICVKKFKYNRCCMQMLHTSYEREKEPQKEDRGIEEKNSEGLTGRKNK